ncbi:MAG: 50S ribosomal protein L13 [Acidimicrobiales bacterium]|nr:50S ribosomal protein L13 [Acidimicrobiales bacterium]
MKIKQQVKTYSPKASEIQRDWWIVDADGMTVGRMATEIARILRGKHKAIYSPHMDTGDHVIVINADKVRMTSNKAERELIHTHSGYPGGLTTRTYQQSLDRQPADTVRKSIVGMIPKNRLGRKQATKLKVYAGPDHPHAAQSPKPLEIPGARRELGKR